LPSEPDVSEVQILPLAKNSRPKVIGYCEDYIGFYLLLLNREVIPAQKTLERERVLQNPSHPLFFRVAVSRLLRSFLWVKRKLEYDIGIGWGCMLP
jgi:hypothetical protein